MALNFGKDQLFVDGGVFKDSLDTDDINIWDGNQWRSDSLDAVTAVQATAEIFQVTPATGTMYSTDVLNDNTFVITAFADAIGEYGQIDYPYPVLVTKVRQYGHINNNGDGVWKLQYLNLGTQLYVDWITGISTRTTNSWSAFTSSTRARTTSVRWVCTTVDTGDTRSYIRELEVIY